MTIIIDTREQKPWDFSFWGTDMISSKLDYGDYTVAGKLDQIFIERKASTSELSNTICTDNGYRRFNAEMERSGKARKVLILEFPKEYLDIFPEKSGIPKSKIRFLRVSAGFLRKRLYEIIEKYDIELYHAKDHSVATVTAFEILEPYL